MPLWFQYINPNLLYCLMVSGMHLQQCHSLQRPLYSFMLVWMPWTLTNGKPAMQGISVFM